MEEAPFEAAMNERRRAKAAVVVPSGIGVIGGLGVLYVVSPPIEPGAPFAVSSFVTAGLLLVLLRAVAAGCRRCFAETRRASVRY